MITVAEYTIKYGRKLFTRNKCNKFICMNKHKKASNPWKPF